MTQMAKGSAAVVALRRSMASLKQGFSGMKESVDYATVDLNFGKTKENSANL